MISATCGALPSPTNSRGCRLSHILGHPTYMVTYRHSSLFVRSCAILPSHSTRVLLRAGHRRACRPTGRADRVGPGEGGGVGGVGAPSSTDFHFSFDVRVYYTAQPFSTAAPVRQVVASARFCASASEETLTLYVRGLLLGQVGRTRSDHCKHLTHWEYSVVGVEQANQEPA